MMALPYLDLRTQHRHQPMGLQEPAQAAGTHACGSSENP
jgi:hypothetical protein